MLVIIGIIVSAATLMFGDPGQDQFKEDKNRLLTLLKLAQEEAVINSVDHGVAIWEQGYSFFQLSDMRDQNNEVIWVELKDDMLRPREVGDETELRLTLEGVDIVMSAVPIEKPQIFLLSSGEVSPFELGLYYETDLQTTVVADMLGNLEISDANEDDF